MSKVVDIKTRQPLELIEARHIRAAIKLIQSGDLFRSTEQDCPCAYRELYGLHICDGCPGNPDQTPPPEDAA